jgi:quinolinate synthase
MKLKIKAVILALNYAIAVIICLALLVADQFSLAERAVYGFGAILIGMAIRNIVTAMIPGE